LNHAAGASIQHLRRYLGSIHTNTRKTVLGREILGRGEQNYRG
jgi:hypothetical protein